MEIGAIGNKIGSSINGLGASITKVDANVTELKGILSGVSSLLTSDDRQRCIEMDLGTSTKDQTRHYRLGQGIFSLQREIDLFDKEEVTDMETMDDGRVMMCIPFKSMIRIYEPERSQSGHINVDGKPQVLTTIDTQTVVFICGDTCKIKLYDIDSGDELKSFIIPEMVCPPFESITMVDKNLVVNGLNKLLIIDYHKEKIVRTIHTDCQPWRLHGVNGKIYCNSLSDYTCKNLYCYTLTDGNLFAITLPSQPFCTTSLKDGSLYVTCLDGSVLHVTSDLRTFKPVENIALGQESMNSLSYDHNNSKLFITSNILSSRSSLLMYNSK